jgi:transposase
MWPTWHGSPSWSSTGWSALASRSPRPVRELTRYPKTQTGERSREVQRPGQGPGRTPGPELSSVATNFLGVSGRAMAEALVAGSHDPEVLAGLATGRLRAKLPALREALAGRFRTDQHGLLVAQILAHIDDLDETIAVLSARIQQGIGPYAEQVALVDTIGGIDRRAAEVILAEIGPDTGPVPHRRPPRLLGGVGPGNNESAASMARGGPARDPSGCGSRWSRRRMRPRGPRPAT